MDRSDLTPSDFNYGRQSWWIGKSYHPSATIEIRRIVHSTENQSVNQFISSTISSMQDSLRIRRSRFDPSSSLGKKFGLQRN